MSAHGQLIYFVQFLKSGELFTDFWQSAPLSYFSPNAPNVVDVLGSTVLSILCGHSRYAHITSIRFDDVNPPLLGMSQVVSEDSARRGIKRMVDGEKEIQRSKQWMSNQLRKTWEPLLYEPWILDIDSSIKPVYGNGEGMDISYNPQKPGRPCQAYHSYFIAQIRLCLDAELHPGKEHSAKYGLPGMWRLLESLN